MILKRKIGSNFEFFSIVFLITNKNNLSFDINNLTNQQKDIMFIIKELVLCSSLKRKKNNFFDFYHCANCKAFLTKFKQTLV